MDRYRYMAPLSGFAIVLMICSGCSPLPEVPVGKASPSTMKQALPSSSASDAGAPKPDHLKPDHSSDPSNRQVSTAPAENGFSDDALEDANDFPSSFTVKIHRVLDSDTFVVIRNHAIFRVGLFGVDAPELEQSYGRAARDFLARLEGLEANLDVMGRDGRRRIVAQVWIDGKSVNLRMIAMGLGWFNEQNTEAEEYASTQTEAQQQHLGLWEESSPMLPAQWRQIQKDKLAELKARVAEAKRLKSENEMLRLELEKRNFEERQTVAYGNGGSSSRAVHVGPRGGVYHYSKNGNKVYHRRK